MTNEEKLQYIKDYIDEIKALNLNPNLSNSDKMHIVRAIETYDNLLAEAQRGKIDPDELHENIASFMYMIQ